MAIEVPVMDAQPRSSTTRLREGIRVRHAGAPLWPQDLAQAVAQDVVLAAARFKPNAAGYHEFALGAGFGHRQLLKARGTYLGERVILGATALHLHALVLCFGGRLAREVGCWRRAEVSAHLIPARDRIGDESRPALLLCDRDRRGLAELQALPFGEDAWELLTLLVRTNRACAG